MGCLEFWRQRSPHWVVLLRPIHRVAPKAAGFEGCPEHEKTLQQARLGHVIQQIQWCLVHRRQIGILFGALGGPYRRIEAQTLRILEQGSAIIHK